VVRNLEQLFAAGPSGMHWGCAQPATLALGNASFGTHAPEGLSELDSVKEKRPGLRLFTRLPIAEPTLEKRRRSVRLRRGALRTAHSGASKSATRDPSLRAAAPSATCPNPACLTARSIVDEAASAKRVESLACPPRPMACCYELESVSSAAPPLAHHLTRQPRCAPNALDELPELEQKTQKIRGDMGSRGVVAS